MIARVLSSLMLALPLMLGAAGASAQQAPVLSDHVKKDIERHRAMAAAHEAAARCLESGKSEDACLKELQAACKGLGIGKHCGMRHVH